LNQLINYKNIINFIRAQRPSWLGYVERRLYSWKPLGTRHQRADGKHVGRKMKVPNWKTIVQDRAKWKGVVEKTKTLRVVASEKKREDEHFWGHDHGYNGLTSSAQLERNVPDLKKKKK
jgi:hypothetical protein